ncbi:MAG: hypothetical protein JXB49_10080 [Bacteroidales bacterium]|nr:hypothetical protein [Bacteroidales bacterium]
MKKLAFVSSLVLILAVLSSTKLHNSTLITEPSGDTIYIGVAPSNLPPIDGNWEKVAFSTINGSYYFLNDFSLCATYMNNKDIKSTVVQIFKSEDLLKSFYNWLEPSIVNKWNTLTLKEKIYIKDFLSSITSYMDSYSEEAEDKYLATNKMDFTKYASHEFWDDAKQKPYPIEICNEYRTLEAFIHRRVKDGIKLNTLINYAQLLDKDLILEPEINHKSSMEGKLLEKFTVINGKIEGEWIVNQVLQVSGKKEILPKEIRYYKDGKKVGEWSEYITVNSKAELKYIKKYKNDKIDELKIYNYLQEKPFSLDNVTTYDFQSREKVVETYKSGKLLDTQKEKL